MRPLPLACVAMLHVVVLTGPSAAQKSASGNYDGLIAMHAAANGVPVTLVKRVMMRESGGNPRAVSRGNYGLMQIRLGTARSLGYSGTAQGLLDANTNLTYAVKYLAGAYRVAGGNHNRAVAYYQRGYYYAAKQQAATRVVSVKDQSRIELASAETTGSIPPTRHSRRRVASSDTFMGGLFSSLTRPPHRRSHHERHYADRNGR